MLLIVLKPQIQHQPGGRKEQFYSWRRMKEAKLILEEDVIYVPP